LYQKETRKNQRQASSRYCSRVNRFIIKTKGNKMNSLMKLKKIELIRLYENEQQRADEQHDIAEQLREELDDIETYEDESHSLDIAKDIMARIKDARFKLDLGVMSEAEEIVKLMDKLEDVLC
jgi:phosphoglycolate phosphatase-like HAD superfamily hydrolase